MLEKAYAKINLCLHVLGKTENGYHSLEMVMVPIDFYDRVYLYKAQKTILKCDAIYVPTDENNTILKAVNEMKQAFDIQDNFEIVLHKNIPTQAGLAGGSADAAAVIRLLMKKYHIKDTEKVLAICKKIGADVPFCFYNKPAIVKGIGEQLTFIPVQSPFYILLVKPRKGVSTKQAFQRIKIKENQVSCVSEVAQALKVNDYDTLCTLLHNDLEEPAIQLVADIARIKETLLDLGFDASLMSGSGSTVFALTRNEHLLNEGYQIFKRKKYFVRKTKLK